MNPTVSVIVPVYNASQYVKRCIISVMNQSWPATECIIVDDASTDDSIAICKRLIKNYSGPTIFKIIHHNRNRGLSAARNTGTDSATSSYIYFIDSDDELTPDCLEKLVAPIIKDDRIEMVMADYRMDFSAMSGKKYRTIKWLNAQKNLFMQETPFEIHTNEEIRSWFYKGKTRKPVIVWNRLLKLSFVKSKKLYNKEGLLFEDQLWIYYLIHSLNHAAFVHDETYIHYRRSDSISMATNREEVSKNFSRIYNEIVTNIVPKEHPDETKRWIISFCSYYVCSSHSPLYRHAYDVIYQQMSDGNHSAYVRLLKTTRFLSNTLAGQLLFKVFVRINRVMRIV